MGISLFVQMCMILAAIIIGVRMRGIGLGLVGCCVLCFLTFFFGVVPSSPPFKIILMMLGAITASAALEAAGALDVLVFFASKAFMRYPGYLVWLSALMSYGIVFFVGTSHIVYAFFPVIVRTAKKVGIQPVKPLVASVVASQQAILASPLSVATTVIKEHFPTYTGLEMLRFFVPATLFGTLVSAWIAGRLGTDPRFCVLQRSKEAQQKPISALAMGALLLFFTSIVLVVFSDCLRPQRDASGGAMVGHAYLTALIMFSVAGILAFFTTTEAISKTQIFTIGMRAIIAILGITWLSRSFLKHHRMWFQTLINTGFQAPLPWLLLFFCMTIVTSSQGTTLQIILPFASQALTLKRLIWLLPAINSFYVLPSYPTIVAAMAFDKTGSTRVGRWFFNHSFMLPGLAGTIGACGFGYVVATWS